MVPLITDRTRREGDERFHTIIRRPAIECAFASAAESSSLSVVAPASRLLTGPSTAKGIPHVTGVRTMESEEISADLIVDAMGRSSKLPNWLEAIGACHPN